MLIEYENVFCRSSSNNIDNFDVKNYKGYQRQCVCEKLLVNGLDYLITKDQIKKKKNIKSSKRCLAIKWTLPNEFYKPLIIRTKEANEDIYQTLLKYKVDFKKIGLLFNACYYCYLANRPILSMSGVLTFKNN